MNSCGQLGDSTLGLHSTSPSEVSVGDDRYALSIVPGGFHTCAIVDDGTLKCWGLNCYGQLGDSTKISGNSSVSVEYHGGSTSSISLGYFHTCTIRDDDTLKCWGSLVTLL